MTDRNVHPAFAKPDVGEVIVNTFLNEEEEAAVIVSNVFEMVEVKSASPSPGPKARLSRREIGVALHLSFGQDATFTERKATNNAH